MIEYKVKPLEIVADNIETIEIPSKEERLIEKVGHTVSFTMKDLDNNIKSLNNLKTEIEAKVKFDTSKLNNIESFHKFVKKMSEQDLHTCWMYNETKEEIRKYTNKLKEVDEQLNLDISEKEEIIKQNPGIYE